jgi:hypothetical protein
MGAISGMFETSAMRYNEKQLYDSFRNSVVSPPYLEQNMSLLEILDFFTRFLAINTIRIKDFEITRGQF